MTDDRNPHAKLIEELRTAISRSPDGARRERLLAILHKLEHSHGTESFGEHVKALIQEAEVDAAGIAPFMSRLSGLLP
jgi:23S rRNA maturation-related 3'-5' exoribonuclease YhaM